jgi:hypothetical protein
MIDAYWNDSDMPVNLIDMWDPPLEKLCTGDCEKFAYLIEESDNEGNA